MTNTPADRQAAADRQAIAASGASALLSVALITSLFRLWFAWRLPITGDEAYFFLLGHQSRLGLLRPSAHGRLVVGGLICAIS